MKNNNKKGFTIIELIVVIAIIGVLMSIGMPRFLGYTQKARLTRIKHDVKVMENEMEIVLSKQHNGFYDWEDNDKDLSILIMEKKLFEHTGIANKVIKDNDKKYNLARFNKKQNNVILGMGGPELTSDGKDYKIIPNEYKDKIKTKLKGTFYSNTNGKVYYEPDKPIGYKPNIAPNCKTPLALDYEFDYATGTIIKYNGKEQYLVIPEAFLVNGQCWPVKIIGKGAFLRKSPYPPIKEIILPLALEYVDEDAFDGHEVDTIIIPPNVKEIGNNAFAGNSINNVIINNSSGSVNIDNNSFGGGSGGNSENGANIKYITPNDKDLNLTVTLNRDINGKVNIGSTGKPTGIISNGGTGIYEGEKGKVVVIPPIIEVNDEEIEITGIGKGAFQGEGLIHVTLPEGLERIEDYAFAGNQLIGVGIPKSVKHIGNYAFSFNELTDGNNFKWTINYINIKDEENINKVNKNFGDIYENGVKVDNSKETNLLNHIWINSNSEILSKEEGLTDFSAFLTDKEKAIMKEKVESLKKITLVKTDKKIFNAKIKEVENHLSSPKALKSKVNTIMKELIEIINNDLFYIIGTTGNEIHWIVPIDGTYEIGLRGGKGGDGGYASNGYGGGYSGRPGIIGQTSIGLFNFKEGDIVTIYQGKVGSKGSPGRITTGSQGVSGYAGNGGGGQESYVKMGNELLISAQGGQGGRGGNNTFSVPLGQGQTFNSGEVVKNFRNVANSQTYVYRIAQ